MRTRQADLSQPEISRVRRGSGFAYYDADKKLVSPQEKARIQSLAIPPAWEKVWIADHPQSHILATGYDQKGRLQYLYHPDFKDKQNCAKFDHVLEFADSLPSLRRQIQKDLAQDSWPLSKCQALSAYLLDSLYMRIGSEQYDTYGLATIRKEHVSFEKPNRTLFDYPGKHNIDFQNNIDDHLIHKLLHELKRRRQGKELLAYKDHGKWMDLKSYHINDYLHTHADGTAKDFRSWHATVLACLSLSLQTQHDPFHEKMIAKSCQETAIFLGNTPAVCKSSYIDPRLWKRFKEGISLASHLDQLITYDAIHHPAIRHAIEKATRSVLLGYDQSHTSAAISRAL